MAGNLTVHQWCVDFQQADQALAQVTECGPFVVEQNNEFDALTQYDSPEEMRAEFYQEIQKYAREPASVTELVPVVETITARTTELL